MSIRVDAYTNGGVCSGLVARPGHLRELLEASSDVTVERAIWLPLDGTGRQSAGSLPFAVDDLVVVAGDEPPGTPVHATWHAIVLTAGPYQIVGELPTMPGFDPGRALARPTGEFVVLRDVEVSLLGQPGAGSSRHEHALVNRYAVDHVSADLMLGFFFPGAGMEVTGDGAPGAVDRGATDAPSPAEQRPTTASALPPA
jgi:hypothetical protein